MGRLVVDRLVVERGAEDALPEVKALAGRCKDGPVWPETAWARFGGVAEEHGILLLARGYHGELCGWLAANRVGDQSELEFVVVAPAWRGHGVGKRLVSAWTAWAHDVGVAEVMLEVRASNAVAIRMYERMGFVEQGRRRGYYREPVEDAVLMGRVLPR